MDRPIGRGALTARRRKGRIMSEKRKELGTGVGAERASKERWKTLDLRCTVGKRAMGEGRGQSEWIGVRRCAKVKRSEGEREKGGR